MKLLERSVEELECTINVLENKVSSEMCLVKCTCIVTFVMLHGYAIARLILSKEKLNDNGCREKS